MRSLDFGGLTAGSFTGESIGVVLGDSLEWIAREYAQVTGREVIELPASALSGGAAADALGRNATVVVSADRVSRSLLMRFSQDDIWVLTARSSSGFLSLLRRMSRQRPSIEYRAVSGMEDGEVSQVRPLAAMTSKQVDILTINAHGWDCMLHFADGVICGKQDGMVPEMAGPGIPSCFTSPGTCRRIDVKPADRIRFSSIRASIIYVNSCRSLRLNHPAEDNYWSLAMSALDGFACAYVSTPWMVVPSPSSPELFREELAAGASLGDAMSRVNQAIRMDGSAFGTFNLIGDGGFCPVAPDEAPGASAGARSPATPGRSLSAPPAVTSVTDDRLSRVLSILTRLFQSSEQGIDVLASEPLDCLGRIRGSVDGWVNGSNGEARQSAAQLSEWEREASRLQDRAVRYLVDRASGLGYDYSTEWAEPRRAGAPQQADGCVHCGSGDIWKWHVTHGIWQEPLAIWECSECTEVGAGDPGLLARLSVHVPAKMLLGETFEVVVTIAAGSPAIDEITVGVTIANEDRYGGNLAAVQSVSSEVGGECRVGFTGWFDPSDSPNVNDRRQVVVFLGHLGRFASAKRPIWVQAPAG
jgi:hypothetical protein